MKSLLSIIVLALAAVSCRQTESINAKASDSAYPAIDSLELTNNFYDNTETYSLPVEKILITGEVHEDLFVDPSTLPLRSVIVKETLPDSSGTDRFVGAYRYDGYSLFDILTKVKIRKANSEEFNPIIDLFVEIEGKNGEVARFSWGEIFYPDNLHGIIVASAVSRIVPSKTKDLWPLPKESKIISSADLITCRNIGLPVRITVKSYPASFVTVKGLSPLYSDGITLKVNETELTMLKSIPSSTEITYNTIFYGRGKGIHSTTPFRGQLLKDVLQKYYPVSEESLKRGILCIAARDGYRISLSYSELFNRNDQQEFMLVTTGDNEDGGKYRVFPSPDFFSDRAVKSVTEIRLLN